MKKKIKIIVNMKAKIVQETSSIRPSLLPEKIPCSSLNSTSFSRDKIDCRKFTDKFENRINNNTYEIFSGHKFF